MSKNSETFADVLARARQGDNEAMTQLIRQYEPQIRRAARTRLGPALRPRVDSIDLVQSVHRSLMGHLRRNKFAITKPEDLTALAVTFVTRKVSHLWRTIQLEERVLRLVNLLRPRISAEEDPAASVERLDCVRHLLEEVDDSDRRLLELHLENHSTKEIAARLNLKENGVRARRSRLFRRLRENGIDPICLN
jgi:RNA polymerase sigma-70 factor (ECF subfamily)